MNFAKLLTTAAKTVGPVSSQQATLHNASGETVRHASTGDPRLDLAHADRNFR